MRPEPRERIDLRGLTVWKISAVIKTVILAALAFGLGVFLYMVLGWSRWVLAVSTLLTLLYGVPAIIFFPKLRWQRWRYEVTNEEIDLQRGLWFINRTIIPMVRVQHVDTEQGIIMRRYGLATVSISTAAGTHEIPALSEEVAGELRDRIARLARVTDDVV
ncbi:PH domain-containing protein [Desulfofalx alkaliphila]|uniref:PH domain-containing protein n=1 Tax=Desulfofalx alkaliphila TaxID=105483 RepID=UPI0004E187E1|nr:PH domain-containing protein [Desulfofalx alkaliphila]